MHKNKLYKFWQGKGFYVALAVVIIGSAVASYVAISGMMQRLGENQSPSQSNIVDNTEDIPWNQPFADVETKQEEVPVTPSQSSSAASGSSSQATSQTAPTQSQEPDALQTAQNSLFCLPVQGAVLQNFSENELVYNETMGDWRTHNGVDISCETGYSVNAPTTGIVTLIEKDGQWGGVVEITADDITVRVCGVADIGVKEGDEVKMGANIGKAGTVLAETALSAHVHVEFKKDGKYLNPADYLTLE